MAKEGITTGEKELPGHGLQENRTSLGETVGYEEDCHVKRRSPKWLKKKWWVFTVEKGRVKIKLDCCPARQCALR